jgi:hypothetical protein
VLSLSVAVQHQILDALQVHLGRSDVAETPSAKRRVAITALREVAGLLGRSPSVKEYRRARLENPHCSWPTDSNVRTWLGGGWNACLRQAHLDEVAEDEVVVRTLGPAFTAEEIVTALRECADDLGGPPSFTTYVAWVQRPDVAARRDRFPESHAPFRRVFGGFPQALAAAGFGDEQLVARSAATGEKRVHFHGRVHEDVLIEALKLVAKRLGRSPRKAEYESERELIMQEALEEGRLASVPTISVFQKHWPRWADALSAAGLDQPPVVISRDGRVVRHGQLGPQTTDEEALGFLREACEARGFPLARTQYEAWRKDQLAQDRARRRLRKIPSSDSLRLRFGGWDAAQMRAFGSSALAVVPAGTGERETSREEALTLLREACEACGYPLAMKTYDGWRLRKLDQLHEEGVIRRMPSSGTIAVRFGSWQQALALALNTDVVDSGPGPDAVTEEEALAALREAQKALGFPFTRPSYDAWRVEELERRSQAGDDRRVPQSEAVRRRLGGWRAALARLAGHTPLADAEDGALLSDEAALELVRRAQAAVEAKLSREAYDVWRKEELARAHQRHEQPVIPCSETLRLRFGSWHRLLVLADGGDDPAAAACV